MEELKARIREFQSLQNKPRSPELPNAEVLPPNLGEDLVEASVQNGMEPNVVELPSRELSHSDSSDEVTPPPPKRRNSPSKRKSQNQGKATKQSAKQSLKKTAVAARQWREMNPHPYLEELQRLEIQAERINQLLVERFRQTAGYGYSTEVIEERTADGTIAIPSYNRKNPSNFRKVEPYQTGEDPLMPGKRNNHPSDDLEAQAESINQRIDQLLAELAQTMQQAQSITEAAPRTAPPRQQPSTPEDDRFFPPKGQQPPVAPPFPQGLTSSPPTMKQAVQEAAETAQALRYLSSKERIPSPGANHSQEPRRSRSISSRNPIQRFGLRLKQFLQMPRKPMDRLGDAVLWVVIAAVARVGGRFLVITHPALAPVIIVLMLTPAALAVYLACCVPRAGFVSVYRLFLIMVGLLLGGRL
jgi:hypothetical protein